MSNKSNPILIIIACMLVCNSVQHRYQPNHQYSAVPNPSQQYHPRRQNNNPINYHQHHHQHRNKPTAALARPQMNSNNKPFTSFNAAQFADTSRFYSTTHQPHHKGQSVIDVLSKNSDQYSTLITAAQKAGLVDTLSTGGPFTIFAPTNDAFNALPAGTLTKLLDTPDELKKVLLGHVSSGNYPVNVMRSGDLPSLNGASHHNIAVTANVTVTVTVTVDGANVIGPEQTADNGVIHTIDRVLLLEPPQSIVNFLMMRQSSNFSILVNAINVTKLIDTLSTGGPFTLFAPTNDAFAFLPEGALEKLLAAPEELKKVLLGHVVSGNLPVSLVQSGNLTTLSGSVINIDVSVDGVKIDGAFVVGNESIADNGIIHTIDRVLLPAPKQKSILDILNENSDIYSTLITAVKAADLVETLATDGGPFTLFAPTNDAFAALPEGTLAKLLAAPKDLKNVLLGHVSSGYFPVALIRSGDLPTLDGDIKSVDLTKGVNIGEAEVIGEEFIVNNGVIHTIDKVLLP